MNKRMVIAQEFAKNLSSDKINTIILFGSVARGEDTELSDIDLLIVTGYWEELDNEISKLVGKVMIEENELISTHIMDTHHFNTTKNYSFLSNVLKEGIILI
ncbi:MAG: nucleotidyltransferase domain-containing protein [Methanosphaera sp.]|nr:nucleotidyltransferase domain-containing protein [Methanosphaera sp.]